MRSPLIHANDQQQHPPNRFESYPLLPMDSTHLSHSATSVPEFGQGRDLKQWIRGALEKPFNASESNANKSIQDYDQLAAHWEHTFLNAWNHYKDVKTLMHNLITHLPLGPGAIVLDLGGATGKFARFLVENDLARKVISVDISPRMTEP